MSLPDRPPRAPDREEMKKALAALLLASGAELDAETRETPDRVAKAWAEDLLDGYAKDPVAALGSGLVPAPLPGELVVATHLDFHSMCPHHLLPYRGTCAVGYVAEKNLVGFGKIAEALEALSHRLILQEQLVHKLRDAVQAALAPRGVGVVISAEHACMQARGPKARHSRIVVEAFGGVFETDADLRARFARRAEEKL